MEGQVDEIRPPGEVCLVCCLPSPAGQIQWNSKARCVSRVEQEATVSLDEGFLPKHRPASFSSVIRSTGRGRQASGTGDLVTVTGFFRAQ